MPRQTTGGAETGDCHQTTAQFNGQETEISCPVPGIRSVEPWVEVQCWIRCSMTCGGENNLYARGLD